MTQKATQTAIQSDTHTTNGYYPHKLLINRLIPDITPSTIPPIEQTIPDDSAVSGEILHARRSTLLKEIVLDAAFSAARIFRTPADVIRHGTDGTTPQDGKLP